MKARNATPGQILYARTSLSLPEIIEKEDDGEFIAVKDADELSSDGTHIWVVRTPSGKEVEISLAWFEGFSRERQSKRRRISH